jgi:beta-glucosidase
MIQNGALPFPQGFLWGAATAAHQVEGNNTNNDWWEFEQRPGAMWNSGRSGLACNWWRDAEPDFDRMAAMGHNTHRLSVEWSRIEPEEGVFDPAAVARYREMLLGLRRRGIEPMVTLFHFSSPLWLARLGGWSNPAVVGYFRRFVRYTVEQLGDLVTLWCTINEPNIYALMGYLAGIHPPGKRSLRLFARVWKHLLLAHAAAYRAIHTVQDGAQVGLVINFTALEPLDPAAPVSPVLIRLARYLLQDMGVKAVAEGRLPFPIATPSSPAGALLDSTDFWGVNYYMRFRLGVSRNGGRRRLVVGPTPGAEVSDSCNGNPYGEIYPEGLHQVLMQMARLGKPIYVTENGLPDADDDQRPRFLLRYLAQVQRAVADGADVRGYYFWTLTDNFEWTAAWEWRFGLFALDEKTQVRTARQSARLYEQIIRANAITPRLVSAYAPEVMGELFPGREPAWLAIG